MSESFSTGQVTGREGVGGLVGANGGTTAPVDTSYWDVPASGLAESAGGEGLGDLGDEPPADEMTGHDAPDNMDGFDFEETGETVTDPEDYPALRALASL